MAPGPGSSQDEAGAEVQQEALFGNGSVAVVAAGGAAQTLPPALQSSSSWITLTAGCAITIPPPVAAGERRRVFLTQGGAAGYAVTWVATGGTLKWAGGATPTITVTLGKTDFIELESIDGVNWLGKITQNF